MRRFHRTVAVSVLLGVFALSITAHSADPSQKTIEPGQSTLPKITISRETTYITEPLRPDGHPDYVAALNQRLSEGVTPQNNAAVLLLEAIGPVVVDSKHAEDFYRRLDIKPLPKDSQYLVQEPPSTTRWLAANPNVNKESPEYRSEVWGFWDRFERASVRPWSAADFPDIAEWIAVNSKPLDRVVEATRRPKFY